MSHNLFAAIAAVAPSHRCEVMADAPHPTIARAMNGATHPPSGALGVG